MDKEKLIAFLNEHREDIDLDDWDKVFYDISYNCDYLNYLTCLLDEQEINYLPYISSIYWYMYAEMGNRHRRTSFVVPKNITGIDDRAFLDNMYLTKIYIPKSVEKIGEYVFEGCAQGSILTITYEGSQDEWDDIQKDSNWRRGVKVRFIFENK